MQRDEDRRVSENVALKKKLTDNAKRKREREQETAEPGKEFMLQRVVANVVQISLASSIATEDELLGNRDVTL